MLVSKPMDRLYLERETEQDIYVDLRKPLLPHQIDGIRFLYRQFKKKSPGVILNDPLGYGKCLQVVLFLNATLPTLKNPILILTHAVDKWKEIFDQWTDCRDVAVRSPNQFCKERVYINPVEDGLKFSRRTWGMVVLHNNDFEDSTKGFLQMRFRAEYQIWITSTDMKENLSTLSSVYEWLHPKHKFNVATFTPINDWKDKLLKSMFLDTFLEDVLLRRIDFGIPVIKMIDKPSVTSPVKPTRKNKDPTGTKVKRSKKRRIEDDDLILPLDELLPSKSKISSRKDNEMDVENFIMNEKPICLEEFKDLLHDSNAEHCIDVATEVSKTTTSEFDEVSQNENSKMQNGSRDNISLKLDEAKTHNERQGAGIQIAEIEQDHDRQSKIIVPETENSNDSISLFHYSETQNDDMPVEDFPDIDKTNGGSKNVTIIPETEDSEDTQVYENDTLKLDETASSYPNDVPGTVLGNNKSKLSNESIEKISKEINKEEENTNLKSNEIKAIDRNEDDLEAKLAELEAKALKQFKGSMLDRIF